MSDADWSISVEGVAPFAASNGTARSHNEGARFTYRYLSSTKEGENLDFDEKNTFLLARIQLACLLACKGQESA
ncbi:unnamed protein product [Leptosia nina]|uniref:Uncharacterized protein n=1 Tax=Leptosia nina TaxID=320188 RepID=A0AAV1J5B6_9NEOP